MDYYVYLYWRLDTNEVFYVGKGHNDRWKKLNRKNNEHFNNIVNKYPIAVEIIKDNLTENEAFYWEEEIIKQLVFEYGFSINIKGNYSTDHYCHLVNQTWGGEGTSGINPRDYMTEEAKRERDRKISEAMKGKNCGENNPNYGKCGILSPMYGKNYRDYMTEEAKREHDRKISEANKGENNPMYGKNYRDYMTEEAKKKRDEKMTGKNNPRAKSVITIINDKIFATFDYAKQGAEYFNCANSSIVQCCKGKLKSSGKYNGYKIVWRYIDIIEL